MMQFLMEASLAQAIAFFAIIEMRELHIVICPKIKVKYDDSPISYTKFYQQYP